MKQHPARRKATPMRAMAAAAMMFAAALPTSAFGTSEPPVKASLLATAQTPARLPPPGTYDLLRIMRLPDTRLVDGRAREVLLPAHIQ